MHVAAASIFKVAFSYVSTGGRPEVLERNGDASRLVSARDAEKAIAKVRSAVKRERYDIVVHGVEYVSSVDIG